METTQGQPPLLQRSTSIAHFHDERDALAPSILRRSCHFCRGRKIRCSGSSICSACQERNIDCVYDVQSGKGRPKGRTSKSTHKKDGSKDKASVRETSTPRLVDPNSSNTTVQPNSPPVQTIEQALNFMFDENFTTAGAASANIFQKVISDFSRQARHDQEHGREICGYPIEDLEKGHTLSYDGLLSNIRSEMMAMIATRFGSLGCQFNDSSSKLSYLRGLLKDNAKTMLDSPYHGNSPLLGLDPHRILQLIDTWFSIHPLSPLVSKTLLLTSLKSNTTDDALLAIILADAISAHGTSKLYSGTTNTEENLAQYAILQVRNRSAVSHKISTVQALVLIGWREMCRMNHRRATCWLGYAGRAVAELESQIRLGGHRNHQRMNGIEVGMVESEIVRNVYWVTFSCTFWAMMQMGAPFSAIIPKSFGVEFPPVNESCSAIISLDMASDNISTLLAQSRSLRELWPLSHIVCTMTHICALDPRSPDADDRDCGAAWQSRHLHKLRRLLSVDSEITSVCSRVCGILQEAIHEVDREIQDGIPKSIVICAYRTVIVQLLFPRSSEEAATVTPQMVSDFCQAMYGLPELALSMSHAAVHASPLTRDLNKTSPVAETLALTLDACGRGLMYLYRRAFSGSDAEYYAVANEQEQLLLVATQLHEISKLDLSRSVSFIRPVKRRLKEAKIAFSGFGAVHGQPHQMSSISGTSPQLGRKPSSSTSATSTPMTELPSFLPQLEDYSASNSGVGTPLHEAVQMSYYGSPTLDAIVPTSEKSRHDSYFHDMDMLTFNEAMHSKLTEYATPGSMAETMHLDNNTWLYLHQTPEPMPYNERRPLYSRPSVTSDPGSSADASFTTPFTSMPLDPSQYVPDDTRYW